MEITVASVTINLLLLFILVLCIWTYAKMTFGRSAKLLSRFPHYRNLPLLGNIQHLPWSPKGFTKLVSNIVKCHGRISVFWVGILPYVVLLEPQSIQKILSSRDHLEKGSIYRDLEWIAGNGPVTSKPEIWKNDRKMFSSAFKYKNFEFFLGIFNKCAHILCVILENTYTEKKVNLHPIICRATMDAVNESVLGVSSTFQYDPNSTILKYFKMCLRNIQTRALKPYLKLPVVWYVFGHGKDEPTILECAVKMVDDAVKSRKEVLMKEGKSSWMDGPHPLIDYVLSTKSDKEICDHVLTLFVAGFETTASGMNYTLFLLANNPTIQAKVHAELDEVFGRLNDSQPGDVLDVTFAHLAQLKYLEMCIKESLRMYPPGSMMARVVGKDVQLDEGLTIPRGCEIIIPIYGLHWDPEFFPEPEKFCPDRFLPENCSARHPCAYLAFSNGPRNCLGSQYSIMQMKVTLAQILRRFRVSTTLKTEDMHPVYGLILEPSPTIEVTLTDRKVQ